MDFRTAFRLLKKGGLFLYVLIIDVTQLNSYKNVDTKGMRTHRDLQEVCFNWTEGLLNILVSCPLNRYPIYVRTYVGTYMY